MRTIVPFYLLLVVMILSCGLPAQTRKKPLRPAELIENANTYLNQPVNLEILEPLYGPSKPEDLVRAEYGQVEVRVPEGMSGTLSLVPAAFKVTDPNRYRNKFDRVIESPGSVKGELLSEDEMWLDTAPNTKIIKSGSVGSQANRVRVTGILFARPGAHYGHLGGYRFQLTASKIEYLGVVR